MEEIIFPNISLSIKIKTKCNKSTHKCIDYYNFTELYKTLETIENYELGGEYDPKFGFVIDPKTSYFDEENQLPYTKLNISSNTHIVFHSHPFNHVATCYPSIEDLDMCRMYPKLVFLIITERGVYIISALKSYISIDLISSFYRNMQSPSSGCQWNYSEIEESFLNNKGCTKENTNKHGLFVHFICKKLFTTKRLNEIISYSFNQKEITQQK